MNLKEKYSAFLIILLIAIVYLHPIFFGKVDTPIDIRDVQMYPWRYYTVDKKVKKSILWKCNLIKEQVVIDKESESPVFNFVALPNSNRNKLLNVNIDKPTVKRLRDISDANYYLSFDFKPVYNNLIDYSFGILLVDKVTNLKFVPGIAILQDSSNKSEGSSSWYTAYLPLNNFLRDLTSIEDLNDYNIQITLQNRSRSNAASLYLRDLRLVCEDFSQAPKVHNRYINDLIQWFTPAREYFSNSLKKGIIPFWSNYTLTGSEFLAEPQIGFFHPLYFLPYLLFEHFTAHSLITFLCFVLSGIGAFTLARYWGLGYLASLLTSIVYMFHPFNVTWFSFEHMLMNSATLPFLFLTYEKNLASPRFVNKYLLLSTFLLGLIFISGHLQIVYYSLIFFFLFALFKFVFNRNHLKNLFSMFFTFTVAMMIGAIVLVPFFSLFQNSHRVANTEEFIKSMSIPLKAFLGLIAPFYKGYPKWLHSEISDPDPSYRLGFFKNYVYFGFLPFLFLIFSLVTILRNRLTSFFLLSITFSLLVCTGSPLFFLIKDYLPGFKQLQHYRFLEIYSYCVPFLSGIGFQALIDLFSKFTKRSLNFVFFILILVSIFDLMYNSAYFITWSDKKTYKSVPKNSALEFLINEQEKSKEPFRVLPFVSREVGQTKLKLEVAESNTLQPYKLEEVSGYSSLIPKDIYSAFVYIQTKDPSKLYTPNIVNLFANTNIPYPIYNFKSKILDLLNVKYFLVPPFFLLESKDTKEVFKGDCKIYENKNYFPRAFMVPNFEIIRSSKEIIQILDSDNFNPREYVLLKSFPKAYKHAVDEANNKPEILKYKIKFVKYEQNKIVLKVYINRTGILVLGNNLNDNWRVKINNKQSNHFQANLVQRAVFLPKPGTYLVEFYYFPGLFLIGFLITCFGIFILLTVAIVLKLDGKKRSLVNNDIIKSISELEKVKVIV